MERSTGRLRTTHVGSLIRPPGIYRALRAEAFGEDFDHEEFERELAPAVVDVVARQAETGIDVPSDGEFGKNSWTNYVVARIGGIQRVDEPSTVRVSKDTRDFAEFYSVYDPLAARMWRPAEFADLPGPTGPVKWVCTGELTYKGAAAIERDIANLQAASKSADVSEAFLPLAAPASVEAMLDNRHYASDEDYLMALADVLRNDYLAVVDAGLLLQIDDAFIPFNYDRMMARGATMAEYIKHCELRVEAANHALRGIPEDRIRYHICWGSWAGPHTSDVPLADIVGLLLKINAQAYLVEAANPRHEYEWEVWKDVGLADGKILIPGVVTHSTNVVEHPETVAQRLGRFASVVGKENLMAGTDCGFSQGWSSARTHPTVQWAKLQSLVDGARIASERLWA